MLQLPHQNSPLRVSCACKKMNLVCMILLLAWFLQLQSHEAAAGVPAVIVFGDSSVDAGNNNYIPTIARSNFAPYGRDFPGGKPTGRFSNGRLSTDFISEAFGLPPTVPPYLDPSLRIDNFMAGVCFASAASGFDNATANVLSVIPLWKQVEHFRDYSKRLNSYLGKKQAHQILSQALYVVSLGTNDFLENYYSPTSPARSTQFTIEAYQDFLLGIAERFIRNIYRLGARKIDLTSLSPMGCLPLERVTNMMAFTSCNEQYNNVAKDFNIKLQSLVERLNQQLPNIKVVYTNVYDVLLAIVQDPSSYGFEDDMTGCCGTGLFEMGILCKKNPLTCEDASKYVFWDSFHPTERTNSIIANYAMDTSLAVFR